MALAMPQLTADPSAYTYAMATSKTLAPAVASSIATSYEMDPGKGVRLKDLRCKHNNTMNRCLLCGSVRLLAYSWAKIASEKNSHKLLSGALKLAAQCDIPVATVLSSGPDSNVPLLAVSSRCPQPIHDLLTSGGLCWARGIISETDLLGFAGGFITNSAFNEVVADASDLAVAWRESGGRDSLVEQFLHEEDTTCFAELFEKLSANMQDTEVEEASPAQAESYVQGETTRSVRVLDRRTGQYLHCLSRLVLYIRKLEFWMAAQFVPVDTSMFEVAVNVQAVPTVRSPPYSDKTDVTASFVDTDDVQMPAAASQPQPGPDAQFVADAEIGQVSQLAAGERSGDSLNMDLTADELVSMIAEAEKSGCSSRKSSIASITSRGSKADNLGWTYDELAKELSRSSFSVGHAQAMQQAHLQPEVIQS